ncbi:recombinase family protein [Streptomyces sp. NPDC001107]
MPRLFGFEDVAHRRVRESEAEGIRGAISRRLLKQSTEEVCEWINAEGYRTTFGNPFQPPVLAAVLDHPAIAGLMEDGNGNLVDSGGPRIVPVEDFLAVRAMRPSRDPDKRRAPDREYLLSAGMGVCGLCGFALSASPSNSGSRGHRCVPATGRRPGGCGKVRINADLLEAYLGEQVLGELAKPEVAALIGQARDELLARAEELRQEAEAAALRQEELGKSYGQGKVMSLAAFQAADKELAELIRNKSTQARLLEQAKHVPVGDIPDLVRWWNHAPMASKRGLLVLFVEQIAVYPAKSRGSRTVDEDRVTLKWRSWDSPSSTEEPSA